jgi:hypothetical protein
MPREGNGEGFLENIGRGGRNPNRVVQPRGTIMESDKTIHSSVHCIYGATSFATVD